MNLSDNVMGLHQICVYETMTRIQCLVLNPAFHFMHATFLQDMQIFYLTGWYLILGYFFQF